MMILRQLRMPPKRTPRLTSISNWRTVPVIENDEPSRLFTGLQPQAQIVLECLKISDDIVRHRRQFFEDWLFPNATVDSGGPDWPTRLLRATGGRSTALQIFRIPQFRLPFLTHIYYVVRCQLPAPAP